MKILVCVDGSNESTHAVLKAVEIASGCRIDDVAVLHVYQPNQALITEHGTEENYMLEAKRVQQLNEQLINESEKMIKEAALRFRENGIVPKEILEEGHPAHTITRVAEEGGYDMVIMGSRGRSGLKKLLLGSVSNAVIQEIRSSVLVVK
jgi:nucleotide-binding universal stress UspA family protein